MSMLKPVDRMYLERLFEMEGGYVLSFSNSTFKEFVRGSVGEDIYSDAYGGRGASKANRLRTFWSVAPNVKVATLLGDLLMLMIDNEKITGHGPEIGRVRRIIADLSGDLGVASQTSPKDSVLGQNERKAFVSYATAKRTAGGAVKSCLGRFGYDCFLAHEDLHVSEEWKHRILEELGAADIFVALLSKEFMESKWCGQELGFILSRPEVLVVPVSLDGTAPFGFIEHLHGIRVNRGNLDEVLEEVLYRKRPRQMIPAQIERVRSVGSFRGAEAVVLPLVPHFALFTNQEVDDFVMAIAANSEVWDAARCKSEYIPRFVKVNGLRISREAARELLAVMPDLEIPMVDSSISPKKVVR